MAKRFMNSGASGWRVGALSVALIVAVAEYAGAAATMTHIAATPADDPAPGRAGRLPDLRLKLEQPDQQPTGGNPLWSIPLSSLREGRERPIFLPSRRRPTPAQTIIVQPAPLPQTTAAPAAAIEPPALTFVGAVISDTDGIGVFRNETTKEFIRLRTGEGLGSWILRELRRSEALFESGGETVVVALPKPAIREK